jgi:hypothetical protein
MFDQAVKESELVVEVGLLERFIPPAAFPRELKAGAP